MNRTTTIVLFASIFAVAVGTLGLSGNSATSLMVSAVPQSQEQVGMLGHVEYKILDENGNIVQYKQGDNVVVNDGEDCAADALFGSGTCAGAIGTNYFTYIGIGNGTRIINTAADMATNSTLADADNTAGGNTANCSTVAGGGDMARRNVTASHTPASGATGTVVVLDTSSAPFTFDATNATIVSDSGIFNDDYDGGPYTNHVCGGTNTAGASWDMFARQLLSGTDGITVTSGDSLSVKWTITVG